VFITRITNTISNAKRYIQRLISSPRGERTSGKEKNCEDRPWRARLRGREEFLEIAPWERVSEEGWKFVEIAPEERVSEEGRNFWRSPLESASPRKEGTGGGEDTEFVLKRTNSSKINQIFTRSLPLRKRTFRVYLERIPTVSNSRTSRCKSVFTPDGSH